MLKFTKKLIAMMLCLALLPTCVFAYSTKDVFMFVTDVVKEPVVSSIGGEWAVIGLARSGEKVPDGYFDEYYKRVESYTKEKNGVLHNRKYTEYSRVILALTAIGKNPENVGGYNLLAPLEDFDKTVYQGVNGAIWALIALDSNNYPSSNREKFIDYILEKQTSDGGWTLVGDKADSDLTGMALTSLAKYQHIPKVKAATEKALLYLSQSQKNNGGFETGGVQTAESGAQVLVALCSLGIAPDDAGFVKNGNRITDSFNDFYINGGFKHLSEEENVNLMATEQVFYALVAEQRFKDGKNSLFDMTKENKTFKDIKNDANRFQIEELASRGIISGKSEAIFEPVATMTRAEFCTITVKALGLSFKGAKSFEDVTSNDWFFNYVNTAKEYGIVNGVSTTMFDPHSNITRQEAAVMVSRAAKLCGLKIETTDVEAENILSVFSDCKNVENWAYSSLAFVYKEGILPAGDEIKPKEFVSRSEIALMIYNVLEKSLLLE